MGQIGKGSEVETFLELQKGEHIGVTPLSISGLRLGCGCSCDVNAHVS